MGTKDVEYCQRAELLDFLNDLDLEELKVSDNIRSVVCYEL